LNELARKIAQSLADPGMYPDPKTGQTLKVCRFVGCSFKTLYKEDFEAHLLEHVSKKLLKCRLAEFGCTFESDNENEMRLHFRKHYGRNGIVGKNATY